MTSVDHATAQTPAAKTRFAHRLKVEHVLTAATVVGLFVLWTALSRYKLVNPLFLPPPEAVWNSFIEVTTVGYQGQLLHQHMAASPGAHLRRIFHRLRDRHPARPA